MSSETEDTMLERVARAIRGFGNDTMGRSVMVDPDVAARAAVEAMRKPTEEMIDAGCECDAFDKAVWSNRRRRGCGERTGTLKESTW